MSDLTFLVAISFLVVATIHVALRVAQAANNISAEIVTGVVKGTPVSPGVREGMLFGMWLPYEVANVMLAAFVALAFLQMADHVSGADVKLLVHMAAFLAGCMCGLVLISASFAFFRFQAKLRRVRQHQAEAD